MHVFFQALPKLAKKNLPPIRATWSSFSGRRNNVFGVWQKKSTIDYKNGCNYNYDSNDGNFDDNDDKKHTHIISFE